jgi:hypothetical protein
MFTAWLNPFFLSAPLSPALSQPSAVDRRCVNIPWSRPRWCPARSGGDASVACTGTLELIRAYNSAMVAQHGSRSPLGGVSVAAAGGPLPTRAELTDMVIPWCGGPVVVLARSAKLWRAMWTKRQRAREMAAMMRPMPEPRPAPVSPPSPGLPPRGRPPAQPRP